MFCFGSYIVFINANPKYPPANYSNLALIPFEEPLELSGFIFKKRKRLSKVANVLIAYMKGILTDVK